MGPGPECGAFSARIATGNSIKYAARPRPAPSDAAARRFRSSRFKTGRLGLIGLKKLRPDGLIRLGRGGQSLADTVLLIGRQSDSVLAASPRLDTFSPRGWGPVTFNRTIHSTILRRPRLGAQKPCPSLGR
jgi:hypothetical protein